MTELGKSLNGVYEPLYRAGRDMLRRLKALGYDTRLEWHNLHQWRVNGTWQTEYFPLPELQVTGQGWRADIGLSLDNRLWIEFALSRQAALSLDLERLAGGRHFELYGAEDYLADIGTSADIPALTAALAASTEESVCICFDELDPAGTELEGLLAAMGDACPASR